MEGGRYNKLVQAHARAVGQVLDGVTPEQMRKHFAPVQKELGIADEVFQRLVQQFREQAAHAVNEEMQSICEEHSIAERLKQLDDHITAREIIEEESALQEARLKRKQLQLQQLNERLSEVKQQQKEVIADIIETRKLRQVQAVEMQERLSVLRQNHEQLKNICMHVE